MIDDRNEPPHPLLRDGTSQGMRKHPALPPESVLLDNRSIADLLLWSTGYAERLTYYNEVDHPDGNWRPLWERDVSSVIADIDSRRPRAPGALFSEISDYRELEESAKDPAAPAERIRRFRALCNQMVVIPEKFETWKRRAPQGLGLRRHLDETIEAVLQPALVSLRGYDQGAKMVEGISEPLGLNYRGLDTLWKLDGAVQDDSIYQGVKLNERLDYAIQRLAFLFERIMSAFVRLVYSATHWMEESLLRWPRHEPHFALFLAFLLLFRHAQRHLNGIPAKHLDFFYEQVLRLDRKYAESDRAHLIFELAKHLPHHPIAADTRFSAPKDGKGVEMHYRLEQDFVVNRAKVSDLRALYVDTAADFPDNLEFRISPVANSSDGLGAPLDEAKPRWKTFGHDRSREGAPIGFALASPMFFLAEGKRKIKVTLALTGLDDPTNNIDEILLLQKLFVSTDPPTTNLLRVALTTEEGWHPIPKEQLTIEMVSIPLDPAHPTGLQTPGVRIVVTLNPDDPPIAVFPGTDELPAIDKQWPVFKLETVGPIPKTLYHGLSVGKITRIDLEVSVTGMRNLVLQTDIGPAAPDKPFLPFGPVPKTGSALYVGSWEAFQKTLTEFELHLEWMEVPKSFADRYAGYDTTVSDGRYFTGMLSVYDETLPELWIPNVGNFPLFITRGRAKILEGELEVAKGQATIINGQAIYDLGVARQDYANRLRGAETWYRDNGNERVDTTGPNLKNRGQSIINHGWNLRREGLAIMAAAALLWFFGWALYYAGRARYNQGTHTINVGNSLIAQGNDLISVGKGYIARADTLGRNATLADDEGAKLKIEGDRQKGIGDDLVLSGNTKINEGDSLDDADDSAPGIEVGADRVTNPSMATYVRQPELQPFNTFSTDSAPGFVKIESERSYLHDEFPKAFADAAIDKARGVTQPIPVLPNPPFVPTLKGVTFDYTAFETISTAGPTSGLTEKDKPREEVERYYHLHPFGHAQRWPVKSDAAEAATGADGATDFALSVLPRYDVTRAADAAVTSKPYGALYIGVEGLSPPQNLSLLFQVVEGSADPETRPPEIEWSYLAGNRWKPLGEQGLLAERTGGLIGSGIVSVAMPEAAGGTHRLLPGNKAWLRAQVTENLNGVCDMVAILAQAARVEFVDRDNDPERLRNPLAAGAIAKQVRRDAAVRSLMQPYASFGGRTVESDERFRLRVSERLRHKDRAVTIWDYERLVLENFPSVYKAKCITHTHAPKDPDLPYSEQAPGAVTVVVIANLRNQSAVDHLAPRASLALIAEIEQFLRERVSPFVMDRLRVMNPRFERIETTIVVKFRPLEDEGIRKASLAADLQRFLSPWAYDQGTDIEFGGSIHESAIVDFIDERDYVDAVLGFEMKVTREEGQPALTVTEAVASSERSILVSADTHTITT